MDDALGATRATLLEEVAAAYVNQTRFAAEVARALATRLGLAAAVHKHDELVGLARHWHNETEQELALKADSFALEKVRSESGGERSPPALAKFCFKLIAFFFSR